MKKITQIGILTFLYVITLYYSVSFVVKDYSNDTCVAEIFDTTFVAIVLLLLMSIVTFTMSDVLKSIIKNEKGSF